jgi:hypothetical protein
MWHFVGYGCTRRIITIHAVSLVFWVNAGAFIHSSANDSPKGDQILLSAAHKAIAEPPACGPGCRLIVQRLTLRPA